MHHIEPLRVRWAEVDAQGIVFNGHYLNYLDQASTGFWRRLALAFKDNPKVQFGLVNEPRNMPTETWAQAAQAAVDAIRATGASQLITLPGNGYTGAWSWFEKTWYGTPNAEVMATNPLNKIPTLILDDGTALYDSRVICEYFDTLHDGPRLFPADAGARWTALRRQALAQCRTPRSDRDGRHDRDVAFKSTCCGSDSASGESRHERSRRSATSSA